MSKSRSRQGKAARPRSRPHSVPARGPPYKPLDFPVVGVGASAGGLDACRKLVGAMPAGNGMAFILVQHLDPTHKSMLVDLLGRPHRADGTRSNRRNADRTRTPLYHSAWNLSLRQQRHPSSLPAPGAPRRALAVRFSAAFAGDGLRRAHAVCVILSGTGSDGSLGLKAVKENGGFVIAQDPDEAGYDGMPRSAIATGAVDLVLPVAKIPEALVKYSRRIAAAPAATASLRATREPIGWPRSSIFCAPRPTTISRFTSPVRYSAGSSGAWRWRRSASAT